MKPWLRAIMLAMLMAIPANGSLAADSASIAVSVTVLPSPLQAEVTPDCVFVVTSNTRTVDCTTTVVVVQPTFQFDGWRMMLSVTEIVNPETGNKIPAKSMSLLSYSAFVVHWGQPVDGSGGPYFPVEVFAPSMKDLRELVVAEPGFGIGGYTALVSFRLTVPKKTLAGTYVPTFVVKVSNTFDDHVHGHGEHEDDDDGDHDVHDLDDDKEEKDRDKKRD